MAQNVEDQIDCNKVAQMRQMLADQNKEAVQHRFGEAALNSPESGAHSVIDADAGSFTGGH